jgi:hypothetical protein
VLLFSGERFPHIIQKSSSQLGFVTYLLNCPRNFYQTLYDYVLEVASEFPTKIFLYIDKTSQNTLHGLG